MSTSTLRAAFATVVGVAGIWQPAADWGVDDSRTGFADTLTTWGVGNGNYIVVPVLGAGSARDVVGRFGDAFADPTRYVLGDTTRLVLIGTNIIDVRERTLDRRQQIQAQAEDPYAVTRARFVGERDDESAEDPRARWLR